MTLLNFSQLKKKYAHFLKEDCLINCEFGWRRLIEDFCAAVDLVIGHEDYEMFQILSIKRKTGIIMIDYEGGDDLIKEIVDFTERLSYNTCEICGQEGKLYASDKWAKWSSYKTLCRQHAIQFYYYEINLRKGNK